MKSVQRFINKYLGIIIVFALGALLIIFFVPNYAALQNLKRVLQALNQKLVLTEKKNRLLQQQQVSLQGDPVYIEKIAREKLGWAGPEETIYRFPQTR